MHVACCPFQFGPSSQSRLDCSRASVGKRHSAFDWWVKSPEKEQQPSATGAVGVQVQGDTWGGRGLRQRVSGRHTPVSIVGSGGRNPSRLQDSGPRRHGRNGLLGWARRHPCAAAQAESSGREGTLYTRACPHPLARWEGQVCWNQGGT